jgi:hypothetical protein
MFELKMNWVPHPGPDVLCRDRVGRLTLDFDFSGFELTYGVPDGAPAISHENPRNDDAVRSIAGSTVEYDCTLS